MPSPELMALLEQVVDSLTPDTSSYTWLVYDKVLTRLYDAVDDSIEKLRFFFPETLLLAALDLIDRDSGKSAILSRMTRHLIHCSQ